MLRVPSIGTLPAVLAVSLAGCMTVPSSTLALVSPQRPGISTNANLTAIGMLEHESGVFVDPGDRVALSTLVKYGLDDLTEVYVDLDPLVYTDRSGSDGFGIGDLDIGFRRHVWSDLAGRRAVGDFRVHLPTANEGEGLGTGIMALRTSAALTQQIADLSITGYVRLGFLPELEGEGLDLEHTLAVSVVDPLWTGVTGFGEIAAIFVPELDQDDVLLTVGFYRSFSANLVFDLALRAGLTSGAPESAIMFGITNNAYPTDW